ncbi:hypothetical protein PCASD_12795 [Puccinia coronata f. sp. avenae]|uniref:Uncharacterized protein n=1 Tax=Puccinia coronata f. sp. avenae TaxID=200324 RepID=A0A2N5UVZ7_9BASI|nr:hypothetical protein PCASD_12795 [Puccinia coronata f. sp. avenae]
MPSHLRNGKDLLFKQHHTAKQAAARDAGRVWQQQQLADLASRSGAPELPIPSAVLGYHKLSGANGPASAVRQNGTTRGLSAPGNAQPAGYTFSPAALKRLCWTRELQINAPGSRQDGASLPSRPGHSPLRNLLASNVNCASVQQIDACPPTGGETAICGLALGIPSSIDGWVYDANTNLPLSPHERAAQAQRYVGCSHAPQPVGSLGQGDVCGHQDASSRRADNDVQHISGPMAPVCEHKGSKQLPAHAYIPEPGYLNKRYHHQPLRYAKDDGDIRQLVSQGPAGEDGTIVPNPSPTATQASQNKDAPSHGSHSCGETSFRLPGLYATGGPSSASPTSAATVTPLRAATFTPLRAASSRQAQSPAPWKGTDGSGSSTRADDTWYWTPAKHLPTRLESLPAPSLPRTGGVLRAGAVIPPAATSTPCSPPVRPVTAKWQPIQPSLLKELLPFRPNDQDTASRKLLHARGEGDEQDAAPQEQRRAQQQNAPPPLPSFPQATLSEISS